jgi:FtsZ-interacting cell division protein ZipA
MTPNQTIALIVVIAVIVVALIVVAVILGRRRSRDVNRRRASEIRQGADNTALAAKEQEAKALRAQADAQQAEVKAEHLRREAANRQDQAQAHRADADEQARKADDIDPDVAKTRTTNDADAQPVAPSRDA